LRWAVRRTQIEPNEAERLAREHLASGSWVLRMNRMLMPVRYSARESGPNHPLEAHLLERLASGRRLSITLLTACPEAERPAAQQYLERLARSYSGHTVERRVVDEGNVAEAILSEAEHGYQLLVLGAPHAQGESRILYTDLVDSVVRLSPVPAMIVSGQGLRFDVAASRHRIMVPTGGRRSSGWAAEIALALARNGHADLFVVHVVTEDLSLYAQTRGAVMQQRRQTAGEQAVEEILALGERWGVSMSGHVLRGDNVAEALFAFQRDHQIDLILLGTDVRPASGHLSLGGRVEELIAGAACPIIVVNAP
jgi:nucleotide-binding universal stress UspA family protein